MNRPPQQRRPAVSNCPSLLLTDQENKDLFDLLGRKCVVSQNIKTTTCDKIKKWLRCMSSPLITLTHFYCWLISWVFQYLGWRELFYFIFPLLISCPILAKTQAFLYLLSKTKYLGTLWLWVLNSTYLFKKKFVLWYMYIQ